MNQKKPSLKGGDVGHREGAGADQAAEERGTGDDDTGEAQVLRHLLLLLDSHHWVLCPDVPRPLHRGPGPGNLNCGLRGETSGVPRYL